jgi:hypothetical protein
MRRRLTRWALPIGLCHFQFCTHLSQRRLDTDTAWQRAVARANGLRAPTRIVNRRFVRGSAHG